MSSEVTPSTISAKAHHVSNIDADPATRLTLERFAATHDLRLRDELVQRFDRVVQWVVNRQSREAGHADDLLQVGRLALVQALERYEPARGVRFTSYAIKIISGTLKHYYRDRVSFIRVPRGLQELAMEIPKIQETLSARTGRQPNESEIAEFAGVPVTEVYEAQRSIDVYKPQSIDDRSEDVRGLAETVGGADQQIEKLVEFAPLHQAIGQLEERQRFIMRRRYFDDWSQSKVAASLGISQMHVSRLERDGLRKLRSHLGANAVTGHAMAN